MAKKFQFRLAPVLRYREMLEKEKLKDFAQANRAAEEERMEIQRLSEQRGQTQEQVRELYEQQGDFSNVMEAYRYINALEIGMAVHGRQLAQLKQVVDEKRKVLVEARKDRRALEILRDRRQEEHKAAASREEQAELDELSLRVQRRREMEE